MNAVKQIYLLLICEGFYLGSVCQEWTFPSTITALIGSCVEIPCRYRPARTSGTFSTVWYLYSRRSYPEILNTGDSSLVMEKYRNRTSLVRGEKSCSLRIDPVREGDGDKYYYPGIRGDRNMNAYDEQSIEVLFTVTDKVKVWIYWYKVMTEGEAAIIRCTADHTCRSSPPSLRWNKPGQVRNKSVENNGGNWREESELTYIPSYVDDGSPVQCTATYPNGQNTEKSGKLNIKYEITESNITVKKKHGFTELICEVLSSRPDVTHYIWMNDGSILLNETGKSLTIYNNDKSYRKYSCSPHDSPEDSSSAETCEKCGSLDLPLILGTVAGLFVLLFLILVIYFYLRQKKKSALPSSPIHGSISTKKTMTKDESQYGNIQSNHHMEPPSMRSDNSVDMNVDENCVIYSNSEALQPSYEVEYSTIAHGQPEQPPLTSSRVHNVEDVEYATLKH